MHEASHVIFAPCQTRALASWRVFTPIFFEPRREPPARNSGRLVHRQGPSLREVFSEREAIEIQSSAFNVFVNVQ